MSTIAKWTWPNSHEKITEYLLDKENQQSELIDLLESVGISIFNDNDGKSEYRLNEIDPFTFFRYIYKHKSKNRLKYLRAVCSTIGVKELPSDTQGVPSAQPLSTWMFPFKKDRNGSEIPLLWRLFRQAINGKVDAETFDAARKVPSVGPATITEALFMVNPYDYLPINGPVKNYCSQLKIDCNYSDFTSYENLVATIRRKLGSDLIQISVDADSKGRSKDSDPTIWKIGSKDNTGNSFVDFMTDNSTINIGWSELGDFNELEIDKDEIARMLLSHYTNYSNNVASRKAGEILSFVKKASVGDYVVLIDGQKALKLGLIKGSYRYNKECDFAHERPVDWLGQNLDGKKITELPNTTFVKLKKTKLNDLIDMSLPKHKNTLPNFPLNQILYGPPGTGKTRMTVQLAAKLINGSIVKDYTSALKTFNENLHDRIEFITFHQNYSYEDFVQGLRPVTEGGDGQLSFFVSDGIFKKISDKALQNYKDWQTGNREKLPFETVLANLESELVESKKGTIVIPMKRVSYEITDIGNIGISFRKASGGTGHNLSIGTLKRYYNEGFVDTSEGGLTIYYRPLVERLLKSGETNISKQVELKNYVLIIDEINRANISRVFGELITLIEKDKRYDAEIPLSCKLPSGEKLMVPSNLYIIGTMNTADKSIALLDIALRRRFDFVPMYPKYEIEGATIHDVDLLKNINKYISEERGKGVDFCIGHSYFMDKKDDPYNRVSRFNNRVLPLLMEYYMNDKKAVIQLLKNAISKTYPKGKCPFEIDEDDIFALKIKNI